MCTAYWFLCIRKEAKRRAITYAQMDKAAGMSKGHFAYCVQEEDCREKDIEPMVKALGMTMKDFTQKYAPGVYREAFVPESLREKLTRYDEFAPWLEQLVEEHFDLFLLSTGRKKVGSSPRSRSRGMLNTTTETL